MKQISLFVFVFTLVFLIKSYAVSITSIHKYPYVLLTDDYGILNQKDLAIFLNDLEPRPFDRNIVGGDYNYWQCFPRESIKLTLKDYGSLSEDFDKKDTLSDLEIKVIVNENLIHTYSMRAVLTVHYFEKRFDKWRKIMKDSKYVCLAGSFVNYEHKVENGINTEYYNWIFEKLKTKKGCDSYFYRCS